MGTELAEAIRADTSVKTVMREMIGLAQKFEITNVADYIASGTDQEDFGLDDFPNLAPPYPVCWFEWTWPRIVRSSVHGTIKSKEGGRRIGTLMIASPECSASLPEPEWYTGDRAAKWYLNFWMAAESVRQPGVQLMVAVDQRGNAILNRKGGWVTSALSGTEGLSQAEIDERTDGLFVMHFAVFMAISLLHCRNVQTSVIEPRPLSRQERKREAPERYRYHVLDVGVFRRQVGAHLIGGPGAHSRAIHFARGHFKNFTEDHPLFGKHTGAYWWAPQIRGDAGAGVSEHDYRVRKT